MTYPYHLPDRQGYAIEQERFRHNQALYAFGEFAAFVLMWKRPDYDEGLVGACLRCVIPRGLVADVYQQPAEAKCPECFGTGYEGGFKAIVVRPSVWDFTEQDEGDDRRGYNITQTASVQSTSDFRLRNDDYVIRADGSRWQMRTVSTNHLRTGFTADQDDAIGYNFGTMNREDEDSPVYMIPFAVAALTVATIPHTPPDFTPVEVIRWPIL